MGDSPERCDEEVQEILDRRVDDPLREFGEVLRAAERERRRSDLRHQVALGHLEHAERRAEQLDRELTHARAALEEITRSRAWQAITRYRRLKTRLLGRS